MIKNLYELFEKEGIKYKVFGGSGSARGRCDGFPHREGGYDTVRYGKLTDFYLGAPVVENWVMCWENFVRGNASMPSLYRAYYVQRHDYEKALALMKKNGFTEHIVEMELPKMKKEAARRSISNEL